MKARQLIGKSVVSTEQGRVVGSIADLYLDPANGTIKLLEVEAGAPLGGLLPMLGQRRWVRRADVLGVGPDVITIGSENALLPLEKVSDEVKTLRSLRGTIGQSAIAEAGKKLGQVSDLSVDDDLRRVTAIEITRGVTGLGGLVRAEGEPKTLPWDTVVRLGPDLVVVAHGPD